jgi:hypothetical protein
MHHTNFYLLKSPMYSLSSTSLLMYSSVGPDLHVWGFNQGCGPTAFVVFTYGHRALLSEIYVINSEEEAELPVVLCVASSFESTGQLPNSSSNMGTMQLIETLISIEQFQFQFHSQSS